MRREVIEISGGGRLDGTRLVVEKPGVWRCAVFPPLPPAVPLDDAPTVVIHPGRILTFRRTGLFTEDEEAIIYREEIK